MVEIRAIFGDDDRENEQFLGFYLDNIEEAEERYIKQTMTTGRIGHSL
jgi:hypothetical protein